MTNLPLDQRIGWSAIIALALAAGSWVWNLAVTNNEVQELQRRLERMEVSIDRMDVSGTRGLVRIETKLEAVIDRLERIEGQLASQRRADRLPVPIQTPRQNHAGTVESGAQP